MPTIGPNDLAAKFVLTDEVTKTVKDIERNVDAATKEIKKNGEGTKKVFDAWNFSLNLAKAAFKGFNFLAKHNAELQADWNEVLKFTASTLENVVSEILRLSGVAPTLSSAMQGIAGANLAEELRKSNEALIRFNSTTDLTAEQVQKIERSLGGVTVDGFGETIREIQSASRSAEEERNRILNAAQELTLLTGLDPRKSKQVIDEIVKRQKAAIEEIQKAREEDDQLEIESMERVAKAFADVNEDEAERAAKAWKDSLSGAWSESTQALEDEFLKTSRIVDRFAKEAHATLSQNLFDAVTGEAVTFASFMRSILLSITRQFTDATAAGFLGLFGSGKGGISSLFRGSLDGGGSGSAGQGYGGPPEFAEGGTVYRPTLAVVGEGGEPEDIVPHSKRRQYVDSLGYRGGSSLTVNVAMNVSAVDAASVQQFLSRSDVGRGIGDAVIRRISTDPTFARAFGQ